MIAAITKSLPPSLQGYQWLRTLALPVAVATTALAVAIVGALMVGTGGGTDRLNLFVDGTLSGNSSDFLGGLIGASALFALAAGMASAVNPCGFAMLPAYLGLYLGSGLKEDEKLSPARSLGRVLVVGGAVSAGFVILFGIVGAIIGVSASVVSDFIPWLGLAIGFGLVLIGAWMVGGGKLYTGLAARAAGHMGNPNQVSTKGYFMFGLSYGTRLLKLHSPNIHIGGGHRRGGFQRLNCGGQLFPLRPGHGVSDNGPDPGHGDLQRGHGKTDAQGPPLHPASCIRVYGNSRNVHRVLLVDHRARPPLGQGSIPCTIFE